MEETPQFTQVLQDWSEIFMRRSMHDLVQFSRARNVSFSQLGALMRLYRGQACGVSDLGEHLGITSAAASQMIDRLVQQGLLARSEDASDRRAKRITVTPEGRQMIEDGIAVRQRWLETLINSLTLEQQSQIIQALTLLTQAAIDQHPEVQPAV